MMTAKIKFIRKYEPNMTRVRVYSIATIGTSILIKLKR